MNTVWIIRIFRTGDPSKTLFQLVCYDNEEVANAAALDALNAWRAAANNGSADLDSSVTSAIYVGSMQTHRVSEIARVAATRAEWPGAYA